MDYLKIPKDSLKLLLEKKKHFIGVNLFTIISTFLGSIGVLVTYITADIKDFGPISSQYVEIALVALIIMCFSSSILILIKNKYSHKQLYREIESLSLGPDEYRMIGLIQDTFLKYSNKYLVYYDTIWDCYLFPHYPINRNNENYANEVKLKEIISNELKVPIGSISVKYVSNQPIHSKYSQRISQNKNYHFIYYKILIDCFPKKLTNNNFSINGKRFCWKSLSELMNHKKTWLRNSDVMNFIESIPE